MGLELGGCREIGRSKSIFASFYPENLLRRSSKGASRVQTGICITLSQVWKRIPDNHRPVTVGNNDATRLRPLTQPMSSSTSQSNKQCRVTFWPTNIVSTGKDPSKQGLNNRLTGILHSV